MEFSPNTQTLDIFENVFAFFGTLTPEGFVLSLKGKVFERTNTDPNFLVGQKFSETVYWQASEYTAAILDAAIVEVGKSKNFKTLLDFRVNSQEKIVVELFLYPLTENGEGAKQIFFGAQEVTEREKEIEYYKTRSEHLLYAAENAEIGLWFWDLAADEIYSTPKCNELFEIPAHDVMTFQAFLNIVHPEDRAWVEAALRDSQANGKAYDAEYRVIYSDGGIHWISARGKSFLDEDGNP
jgi:PAS domain-containing protein